jgi:hypothetical protein
MGCYFGLPLGRWPAMDNNPVRRRLGDRRRGSRHRRRLLGAGGKHCYQACQRGPPAKTPKTLAILAHLLHVISHDGGHLASGMVNAGLT